MMSKGFKKLSFEEAKLKARVKQTKEWGIPSLGKLLKITSRIKPRQSLKTPPKKKLKKKKPVSISKLKKTLWAECRRVIRKRFITDGEYYCFTCGNLVEIPHTGHIIASSLCSAEMRYSLDNLRPQCYMCNIYKSGNWVGFYEALGQEYMEKLMLKNRETKGLSYHTDWYLKKIEEYKGL